MSFSPIQYVMFSSPTTVGKNSSVAESLDYDKKRYTGGGVPPFSRYMCRGKSATDCSIGLSPINRVFHNGNSKFVRSKAVHQSPPPSPNSEAHNLRSICLSFRTVPNGRLIAIHACMYWGSTYQVGREQHSNASRWLGSEWSVYSMIAPSKRNCERDKRHEFVPAVLWFVWDGRGEG